MLCTELRDLKTEISSIYHILTDTSHFITEYNRIFASLFRYESVKHDGTDGLLGTYYRVTGFLKTMYGIHGVIHMLPLYTVLRTKSGLMNFGRWRHGTYSAQPDLVYLEGVRCTESRADIMGTAYIVQYDNNSRFRQFLVLVGRNTAKFDVQKLPILHKSQKVMGAKVVKKQKMITFADYKTHEI